MESGRRLPFLIIALAALLVGACGRAPLVPDVPHGPAIWELHSVHACSTQTTDPSGVQISYQFDWGDGRQSAWSDLMNGGVAFADTHSYDSLGSFQIRSRAKNSQKASGWSAPLKVSVTAEGAVAWQTGFVDPQSGDSADFTSNTLALGSDGTAYLTCNAPGALVARKPSGAIAWAFTSPDYADFWAAPTLTTDGTILAGCADEFIYAFNPNGTVKWRDSVGIVNATGALAADGTAYFQTDDSMVVALNSSTGVRLWTFADGGGNAALAVGTDGTVYAVNSDGTVFALDPTDGHQKWTAGLGAQSVEPVAIDAGRNVMYAVSIEGTLQSIDLTNGTGGWSSAIGADASGPVVGPDGSVYIGGGGVLSKLGTDGILVWTFSPVMRGTVSTPAVTADGYVYVLVAAEKKGIAAQDVDSLYAVNPDGSYHWACGLGTGSPQASEYALSAPKLDADGNIYVGDGFAVWCVTGKYAPAQSVWPMYQHDATNTGRAQ
ncbi:MAG TPA: PQQ-binding-like beta-propeller repeat protein [bacterium]|nr:PQQ-binding-like beta-propeller repeat protein [bacterium]